MARPRDYFRKSLIAVLISFLPMLINSYIGFRSLDPDVLDLARSMHVGRWQLFTHFELPSALPHMFAGAKIAMTYAVVGAVVAEFMSSNAGLGYMIMVANGLLDGALGTGKPDRAEHCRPRALRSAVGSRATTHSLARCATARCARNRTALDPPPNSV